MAEQGERGEQLVREFFETLSTGDLEKLRPLFHEDASWTAMGTGIPGAGTHKGRDYIIDEFLAPVRGMFKEGDPKIEIKNVVGRGHLVGAETTAYGQFADGRDYRNNYCWMVEIKDDKIYALREYMDTHYISTLVGE